MKQGIRTFCDICGDNILSSSRNYYKRLEEARQAIAEEAEEPCTMDICDNCIKVFWIEKTRRDAATYLAKQKANNTFRKIDGNETN